MNFSQATDVLGGKARKTLRANLVLRREFDAIQEAYYITLELHGHQILTWHTDGSITVSTCGYLTHTTIKAINEYGPIMLRLRKGELYYDGNKPFTDGMTFNERGESL